MFTKIELVNFRSHKHTIIDLCSGINVFVGRGQAGKTNIKRALEWLCFNRPSGDRVHSRWCTDKDVTSVTVGTDDGYEVSIKKGWKRGIGYYLTSPNGKTETFRKVGRNVPDRIQQVLKIEDINIQGQIDQPFLVTDSTGEISRRINEIIDLEVADKWLKDLNSRKAANSSKITVLGEKHTEAVETLKVFKGLDKVETLLKRAEIAEDKLSDAKRELEAIESYLKTVSIAEKKLADTEAILSAKPILEKASKIVDDIESKEKALRSIQTFRDLCLAAEIKVAQYEEGKADYLDSLEKSGTCPFCLRKFSNDELSVLEKLL